MSPELSSEFIGTIPLTVLLVVSVVVSTSHWHLPRDERLRNRLFGFAVLAISAQGLHFLEELSTGFFLRFPAELGLSSWSRGFFIGFNGVWLAIWIVAALGVRVGVKVALVPLWFLALALIVNGVAHPILALRAGGYFPGLVTSPVVGIAGALLAIQLLRLTEVPVPA